MSSDVTDRARLETRALTMLRNGDSPRQVAERTGLTVEDLRRLTADFPAAGPAAPRPIASAPSARPAPVRASLPPPRPAAVPQQPVQAVQCSHAALLERGEASTMPAVRRAAVRAVKALDDLRDLLAAAAEADRLAARLAAEAERKRVEREREQAAATEDLRRAEEALKQACERVLSASGQRQAGAQLHGERRRARCRPREHCQGSGGEGGQSGGRQWLARSPSPTARPSPWSGRPHSWWR